MGLAGDGGGVVGGVGQHLFHIVARFGEGHVFGPNRCIQHRAVAPVARATGASVVPSGGQRHGAIKIVQRQLEVGGADGDVYIVLVDHRGLKIGHADFFGRPLGRGGHHLHQPGGPDVGACVHDEAAFLADQPVHIGGIKPNGAGAGDHFVFERHRVALLPAHKALGALAGVDAAVPHLGLAGDGSGGQQIAVLHAAGLVQVGGVVPFAHAFAAQADADGIQRPRQAGVGVGAGDFLGGGRLRLGRRQHGLPQVFSGQLFVEAIDTGNAAQQGLGACLVGGCALGQQGAGLPVHPGAVLLLRGGHGGDGALHLVPLASTQGGAGQPGQAVVVQVGQLFDLGKIIQRIVRQAAGGHFADHAPDPVLLFGGQRLLPARAQQLRRLVGVAAGQPNQGQRGQGGRWGGFGVA